MAGETKIEDESDNQTPTNDFPSSDSIPRASKSKSHSKDKGSPASASTKRRCVSTACIACRKRKSKARFCSTILYPCGSMWLADQRLQLPV